MTEIRYQLSDVLRTLHLQEKEIQYYEANLSVHRRKNEFGHSYYTQEDMKLLASIHTLAQKGFHINAIESVLPYIDKVIALEEEKQLAFKQKLETALGLCGEEAKQSLRVTYEKSTAKEEVQLEVKQEAASNTAVTKMNEEKVLQIREVMYSIIMEALKQNNDPLVRQINDSLVQEMDYRMRLNEQRQEERFRQLDRTIREKQLVGQQSAVTKEPGQRRQSKFFKKNNVRL